VNRPRVYKDHLSRRHRQQVEALFQRTRLDSFPHLIQRDPRLQSGRHLRARLRRQSKPAFGLAARLTVLLRQPVVRMHLHAQLFPGKDDFDQQWRSRRLGARTEHSFGIFGKESAQRLASVRAGLHHAIVPGEPDFSDWFATFGYPVIPGAEIVKSPYPAHKPGRNAKRSQF